MSYDKSILDQQHILDSIQPEPIEWVYMVVADENTLDSAHLNYGHAKETLLLSHDLYMEENNINKLEICKVNRELFSHKNWKTAYKQSEIIETKTL